MVPNKYSQPKRTMLTKEYLLLGIFFSNDFYFTLPHLFHVHHHHSLILFQLSLHIPKTYIQLITMLNKTILQKRPSEAHLLKGSFKYLEMMIRKRSRRLGFFVFLHLTREVRCLRREDRRAMSFSRMNCSLFVTRFVQPWWDISGGLVSDTD